jgi:hypothetical protein
MFDSLEPVYYGLSRCPFFGGKPKTWEYEDGKLFYGEEINYNQNEKYFYSYILLSSPCNPMEEAGCIDGTY